MEYLSVLEAIQRANVSDKTLRRAVEDGKLNVKVRVHKNEPLMIDSESLAAYISSRSRPQTDLEKRLLELEETIQQMQQEAQNDRLLSRPDSMDNAQYQSRMNALERENAGLRDRVVALETTLQEVVTQMAQLEKDQAGDIAQLHEQLAHADATLHMRLDHDSKRITGLHEQIALLELSTKEVKPLDQKLEETVDTVASSPEPIIHTPTPTYEDEWHVVINGVTKYHNMNGSKNREWLDHWIRLHPKDTFELIAPVFRPSQAPAYESEGTADTYKHLTLKSGETITFLHDFHQDMSEYQAEASHQDVKASCALVLYSRGTEGQYILTRESWDKLKSQGIIGEKQEKRARRLLATLMDRMQQEMLKCGWVQDGQTDAINPQMIWRKER